MEVLKQIAETDGRLTRRITELLMSEIKFEANSTKLRQSVFHSSCDILRMRLLITNLFPLSICLAETNPNRIFRFPTINAIHSRYLEMLSTSIDEELFSRVLNTYSYPVPCPTPRAQFNRRVVMLVSASAPLHLNTLHSSCQTSGLRPQPGSLEGLSAIVQAWLISHILGQIGVGKIVPLS